MPAKFMFLSSMPSITVLGLPNFRVSSLTRIRCCSFSISPQTHKSLGSPHVEQTSAMTLNTELASGIYKSFKSKKHKFLRLIPSKDEISESGLGLTLMSYSSFLFFLKLTLQLDAI